MEIEAQGPPTKPRLDIMRKAAAQFSEDKTRVLVTYELIPDRHCLMAQFTMRTTAQYKAVDEITAGFKIDIWNLDDYMDIWIAFPKRTTKPHCRN